MDDTPCWFAAATVSGGGGGLTRLKSALNYSDTFRSRLWILIFGPFVEGGMVKAHGNLARWCMLSDPAIVAHEFFYYFSQKKY